MSDQTTPAHGRVDAGRLWSGGLATAVVAALVAVAGIVVTRGLFHVPILAPKGEGVWGNANTVTYALSAGAAALVATGLLQLLAITTPRYAVFFSWIMGLLTVIAAALPLGLVTLLASRIATAVLNLILGIAITTTLNAIARTAIRSPT